MKSKFLVAAALVLSAAAAGAAMAQQRVHVPITNPDWEKPFPGFKIVGNTYYVGTYDLGCYLIDTGAGLILINSGRRGPIRSSRPTSRRSASRPATSRSSPRRTDISITSAISPRFRRMRRAQKPT